MSSARDIIEAEDPKSVFRDITAIPKYTVQPIPGPASGFYDFFIDERWLGRAEFVGKCFWQVIWMPEHPGHRQPERFKNADEAAQWMLHHRKFTAEAEDPKSVIQLAKNLPGFHALTRAGFELTAKHPTTQTWIKPAKDLGTWFVVIETGADGRVNWNIRLARDDNSIRGDWYDGYGVDFLERQLKYLCLLGEGEDPKSVFRKAVAVPPPPQGLLQKAIDSRSKYLRKQCNATSIASNPHGETFCYGMFGSGPRKNQTVSTLLVYNKQQQTWQPAYGSSGWDVTPQFEAEDPKGFLKQMSSDPEEQVRDTLRRAGFEQTDNSPRYERWTREALPGTHGHREMIRYEWVGNRVWEYTAYSSHGTIAWHTPKMDAVKAVAFLKRHYFHPTTGVPHA